jgi:hypothetical protein
VDNVLKLALAVFFVKRDFERIFYFEKRKNSFQQSAVGKKKLCGKGRVLKKNF